MQSICILGRQPALGLAELESLYGSAAVTPVGPYAAGLDLHAHDVDFARLGGSTRLAHVIAELPAADWKTIEKQLPQLVLELSLTLPPDGKIQLGLSAFGLSVSPAKLNAMGLTLKKTLRARTGRNVRVTPNPELELNTAQVLHSRLTGPTGVELLIIAHAGKTVIARTTEVQDISSYTIRDRGRPKRDPRVGMLPPKLAQMLINLAAGDKETSAGRVILDPFCGTGVVLQEALLMGYSVYGTDLEPRMIEYTTQNLQWLHEQVPITAATWQVGPAADATAFTWPLPFSAVACETYLGRPFTEKPNAEVLAQTVSEVNLILKRFLQNIHGQLTPGTRLALGVPAWNLSPVQKPSGLSAVRDGSRAPERSVHREYVSTGAQANARNVPSLKVSFKHLPLIDDLAQLGYNRTRFEHVRDSDLLYYREDQIVARELLVLTRK